MGFFARFLRSVSREVQVRMEALQWLAIVILLAISAALCLQWREEPLAATPAEPVTSLSCQDIYKIAYWSRDHFGGGTGLDPAGNEWASRTLRVFLNRLDPYKMLFTEAEAESFRNEGIKQWPTLVANRKCDFFENWAQAHLAPARTRFQQMVASTPVEPLFPKAAPAVASEPRFKKIAAFAKDEAQLKTRVGEAMQHVAESASRSLIAAYDGDRAKLIRDTLEQGMFGDAPLAMRVLLAKAFLGALDQYSTYFSSSEFEEFYHDLAGGTSGIGIKVRPVPRGLFIDKIIQDSPAEASGKLHAGDVIVGIDKLSLTTVPPMLARSLLKGQEHTRVSLKLQAATGGAVRTVSLERERFSFDDGKITSHFLPGTRVGVIDVPSFYGRSGRARETERSSAEDFRTELNKLLHPTDKKQPKAESLVIDLRGNPGGFLEEAVSMAGLFIGDQPVVAVVENHHQRILKEPSAKAIYTGPLVVLVDQDSASASEVLAGALKDYGRAVVVGSPHTYGKGCVQRLFHLDDEILDLEMGVARDHGVVKLTTSIYYSPKGHSPADGGVRSDIVLAKKTANGDDDEEVKTVPVPDHGPAVGEVTLGELRQHEPAHRAEIDFLAQRHQQRGESLKAAVESAVQKDLKALPAEDKTDGELAEAISIATDLVKYEAHPQPQVSLKR